MQLNFYTLGGYKLASVSTADIKEGRVSKVENNYYLDPSLVDMTKMKMVGEGKNYYCPMKKGDADYYNFDNGKEKISELAWIYPKVANTVYSQIDGRIAFWEGKFKTEQLD
jgi:uncharacterized protein (DUF427 family)